MGLLDRFKKSTSKNTVPTAKPKFPVAKKVITPEENKAIAQTEKKSIVAGYHPVQAVLLQPVVTEKSTATGTYYFKVTRNATKNEIRKAFNSKYGKMPRKVNILNVLGKTKMRGRSVGKRSDWKKAVIYLAKDETVELFQ